MTETWRPITGWPYDVSDTGRVRRTRPYRGVTEPGRVLSPAHKDGYPFVTLRNGVGRKWPQRVHLLVLEAFTGPRPNGWVANHINAKRDDNRIENLEWVTVGYNVRYARDEFGQMLGEKTSHPKLNDVAVRVIRFLVARGVTTIRLGAAYGINPTTIGYVAARKSWKHVQ